jgi:hypothetical protein
VADLTERTAIAEASAAPASAGGMQGASSRSVPGRHVRVVPPDQSPSAVELARYQQNRARLIEEHPGSWIAVGGSRLVAVAADIEEVATLARAAGCERPFIVQVPTRVRRPLHL